MAAGDAYATTEDMTVLWRPMRQNETERAAALLPLVSDALRQQAANRGRNLDAMIERGEFREDLYYRLQAFEIRVPPLRAHAKDISPLAEHFLAEMLKANRTTATGFDHQVLALFMRSRWPGNVRELRNVVEYSAIQARAREDEIIRLEHLPASMIGATASTGAEITDFHRCLARAEVEFCSRALAQHERITKSELAGQLGYNDRFVFQRRLRKALALYPEANEEFPDVVRFFA